MKRFVVAVFLVCLFCAGCGVNDPEIRGTNNVYRELYTYYDANVDAIVDGMGVDAATADQVFTRLVEVGVDDEISNIISMSDGSDLNYYRIWWGENFSRSLAVYLAEDGGDVRQICDGETVLYDWYVPMDAVCDDAHGTIEP